MEAQKSPSENFTLAFDVLLDAIRNSSFPEDEIQKGEKQTVLIKKDGEWLITPGNYLADKAKMSRILDAIDNFSISALISEAGDYLRYDLT